MAYRFDLHIQPASIAEQVSSQRLMTFGFDSSVGVKGLQMLLNSWLHCFLTPKGSDPTDLNYGTIFPTLIGSNVAFEDARDIAHISVLECGSQIFKIQSSDLTLSNSERLATSRMLSFIEHPSLPGFELFVEVKNLANDSSIINLPTPFATS